VTVTIHAPSRHGEIETLVCERLLKDYAILWNLHCHLMSAEAYARCKPFLDEQYFEATRAEI
jgi:hypothetical protein